MTGAELKAWRTARGLSQEQMAGYLGPPWTRDMVANREADRAAIPEGLPATLEALAATLQVKPTAPQKPLDNRPRYWTVSGHVTTREAVYAQARKNGLFFWQPFAGMSDEYTRHPLANLYVWDYRKSTGKLHPFCTHIDLDLTTFEARCVKVRDKVSLALVERLNAELAAVRDALAAAPADASPVDTAIEQPAFLRPA